MNRPQKKNGSNPRKIGKLRKINDAERAVLDEVKAKLWEKVGEIMEAGGCSSQADFDFKMQTWVEHEARERPEGERALVLLASEQIQQRFYTVMGAALGESEKCEDVADSEGGGTVDKGSKGIIGLGTFLKERDQYGTCNNDKEED